MGVAAPYAGLAAKPQIMSDFNINSEIRVGDGAACEMGFLPPLLMSVVAVDKKGWRTVRGMTKTEFPIQSRTRSCRSTRTRASCKS